MATILHFATKYIVVVLLEEEEMRRVKLGFCIRFALHARAMKERERERQTEATGE